MNLIKEIQKLEGRINSKLKDNHIEIKIIESKDQYEGKIIILKEFRNPKRPTYDCPWQYGKDSV